MPDDDPKVVSLEPRLKGANSNAMNPAEACTSGANLSV